jgi:hypothetical protein
LRRRARGAISGAAARQGKVNWILGGLTIVLWVGAFLLYFRPMLRASHHNWREARRKKPQKPPAS